MGVGASFAGDKIIRLSDSINGRHNNSFNPTLASESFIIKSGGFRYLACCARASGGLIRALGAYLMLKPKPNIARRT